MGRAGLPSPSTYVSGPVLTPELTGDVTNAVAWLSVPPQFIGAQTSGSAQSVPNATDTSIQIDTEWLDSAGGHRDNTNQDTYYGMYDGWYLVEAFCPINYTGSTGYVTAGVGGQLSGNAIVVRYGELVSNGNSARLGASATHLVQMTQTGSYGVSSNDFLQLFANQTTGASQQVYIEQTSPGRTPYLSVKWVGLANGGVANLPVPANPSWPVPPAYVTSAFLNANIRDTINFLVYPPMFFAYYGGSGSLSSQSSVPNVGTTITLAQNGAVIDNYNGFGTQAYTVPAGGIYYCYGQVGTISQTTSNVVGAGLTVNSAHYGGADVTLWGTVMIANNGAGQSNCAIVRRALRLDAGDTVKLAGFQNDNSSNSHSILDNTSHWPTKMIIIWMSS